MNIDTGELFETPSSLSPYKAWLARHNIRVLPPTGVEDPLCDLPSDEWIAQVGDTCRLREGQDLATGATEKEAVIRLAQKNKWALWVR